METFEYLVVTILAPSDNNLNHYGSVGWELVTVIPNGQSANMTCYFKRKITLKN